MRISWRTAPAATAAALILAATASGPSWSQGTTLTPGDLGLTEAQTQALMDALEGPAATPGISFGSPVGFGADWGEIGLGVGGQTLPSNAPTSVDGSMAMVVGLGDARNAVGIEGTIDVISLRKSFGDDGAFGVKLHTLLPHRSAIAVGVANIGRWGSARGARSSLYAVATRYVDLRPANAGNPLPLAINLGLGDNQFTRQGHRGAIGAPGTIDEPKGGAGLFGGIAFLPLPQLSLIADWTGRSLNLGVSIAPFRGVPLVATAGALNLTGQYQGRQFGDDVEFGAGVGYDFRF